MIKRPARHQRNRTRLQPSQLPAGAFVVATAAINAGNARITTSSPVVVSGLPIGITRQAAGAGAQLLPTGVTQVSATVFDVTFAAACVTTDKLTIPANVSQVRGVAGGSLNPSVTTF